MKVQVINENYIGKKRVVNPDEVNAIITRVMSLPVGKAVRIKTGKKEKMKLYWRLYSYVRNYELPYRVFGINDGYIYIRHGSKNDTTKSTKGERVSAV